VIELPDLREERIEKVVQIEKALLL
jgi:hypothetical protein